MQQEKNNEQKNREKTADTSKQCRPWRKFFLGFAAAIALGIALIIAVPLILGATGVVSVAQRPTFLDGFFEWSSMNSVSYHAKVTKNPYAGDPKVLEMGQELYKEMCIQCHGTPGAYPTEDAEGLYPKPPKLWSKDTQSMGDGELYWVVSNGIMFTAMPAYAPTHSKKKRWAMVSFMRQLPHLTDKQKAMLKSSDEEGEGHH